MKKIVLSLFVILMLLCGCQPTPENTTVIQKAENSESQELTSQEPSVFENGLDIPQKINDVYFTKNNLVKIVLEADVIPNDVDYSVYKGIFTPSKFNTSSICNIIDYFFGEEEIFENTTDEYYSKEDIEAMIISLKKESASGAIGNTNEDVEGWSSEENIISDIGSKIAYLENLYSNAPTKYTGDAVDRDRLDDFVDSGELDIMQYNGKPCPATFTMYYSEDNRDNTLKYTRFDPGETYYFDKYPIENIRGMELTVEQATQSIEKMLDTCKINDYEIDGVFLSNKYSAIVADPDYFRSTSFLENTDQCYVFRLTRTIDGLTINDVLYHEGDTDSEGNEVYAPVYQEEFMEIAVDDTGIISLIWQNPIQIQTQTNTTVLPFDKVMDKFFEQMEMKSIGIEESNHEQVTYIVSKIKLGYMEATQKNSMDEGALLPVWDFYIRASSEEDEGKANYSLLTINAIDGSIINRGVGY